MNQRVGYFHLGRYLCQAPLITGNEFFSHKSSRSPLHHACVWCCMNPTSRQPIPPFFSTHLTDVDADPQQYCQAVLVTDVDADPQQYCQAVLVTDVDANTHAVTPLSMQSPSRSYIDAKARAIGNALLYAQPPFFCGADAGVLFEFVIGDGF